MAARRALIVGGTLVAGACAGAGGAGPGELEAGPTPAVFVEARPKLTTNELFGALREQGADVWIAADRRLGVRLHDASCFESACELLAELDHEVELLDLAYLPVDDLGPLMHVRSTERLDLSGARADLRPLRHLTHLRELSLMATDYSSLVILGELSQLERLDLSGARANLVGIGQLAALRELELSQARTAPRGFELRDGEGLDLAALHDLPQLEVLALRGTKVRDWAPLAAQWTLRRLDLSYTNFRDLGLLEHFAELEVLNVRRTAVVDLDVLQRLEGLRTVDLRDCELVDPQQLQQLRARRPTLEILQ